MTVVVTQKGESQRLDTGIISVTVALLYSSYTVTSLYQWASNVSGVTPLNFDYGKSFSVEGTSVRVRDSAISPSDKNYLERAMLVSSHHVWPTALS